MKSHNEFLKDVEVESSLPAQTCRPLGPESDEDIAMYADEKFNTGKTTEIVKIKFAVQKGDEQYE